MDVDTLKKAIDELLPRIADTAKRDELARRAAEAVDKHAKAATDQEREAAKAELEAIRAEAETAAGGAQDNNGGGGGGGSAPSGFLTTEAYWLVAAVVAASFAFVVWYFWNIGGDKFGSIESTRPLLVLTLIVSMLAFGGLLIMRALFVQEPFETFDRKFRLAREIFLVYSGIFGTIIGFYFGSSDDHDAAAPAVEVAYRDGRVTAAISGGAEPFIGFFTPRGQSGGDLMTANDRVLTLAVTPPACPEGGTVRIVDGRGRQAAGTVDCGGGDENMANNSTDNVVANANEAGGADNGNVANNTQ